MTDSGKRDDLICLVTGASRGIGAAVAMLAAQRGYRVGINYLQRSDAAEALLSQIEQAGGQAFTVQADVSDEAGVVHLFEVCDQQPGRLAVLINNAGMVDQSIRLDDYEPARVRKLLEVNVLSAVLCAQQALRRMSTRHGGAGGAIVNISSIAAVAGSPGEYVDYAATKGAIDTLTIGLGREVATEGVRVNGVRPGIIDTDIHASGGRPDRAQELAPMIPMQRVGTPEEVAFAVLWLASAEASYVTGAMLNVTGGR